MIVVSKYMKESSIERGGKMYICPIGFIEGFLALSILYSKPLKILRERRKRT
jgi:hypothetical protein